ncbi:hypothetical protein, partial [Yanshouia hominis]|uniref:hypothetical protein n=1 Tax=Yanshouia hominis TaxID=2763673 RepID=UPI0021CCA3AC
LFGAVGRPHLYSSKGSFYFYIIGSSLLWNHSPSEWFSTYKKAPPPNLGGGAFVLHPRCQQNRRQRKSFCFKRWAQ